MNALLLSFMVIITTTILSNSYLNTFANAAVLKFATIHPAILNSSIYEGSSYYVNFQYYSGISAAFKEANDDVGVLGTGNSLQISYEEIMSFYPVSTTTDATNKAVNVDNALALLMTSYLASSIALPILKTSSTPIIAPLATEQAPFFDPATPSVINYRFSFDAEILAAINYGMHSRLQCKRFGLVYYSPSPSITQLAFDARDFLQGRGYQHTRLVSFGSEAFPPWYNFTSILAFYNGAIETHPQCIILLSPSEVLIPFISTYQSHPYHNFEDTYYFAASVANVPKFFVGTTLGSAPFANVFVAQQVPDPADTRFVVVQQYQSALKALVDAGGLPVTTTTLSPGGIYGFVDPSPNYYSLEGYIVGRMVIEALKFSRYKGWTRDTLYHAFYDAKMITIGDLILGPYRDKCVGQENVTSSSLPCFCNAGNKAVYMTRVNTKTAKAAAVADDVEFGEYGVATLSVPLEECVVKADHLRIALPFLALENGDQATSRSGPVERDIFARGLAESVAALTLPSATAAAAAAAAAKKNGSLAADASSSSLLNFEDRLIINRVTWNWTNAVEEEAIDGQTSAPATPIPLRSCGISDQQVCGSPEFSDLFGVLKCLEGKPDCDYTVFCITDKWIRIRTCFEGIPCDGMSYNGRPCTEIFGPCANADTLVPAVCGTPEPTTIAPSGTATPAPLPSSTDVITKALRRYPVLGIVGSDLTSAQIRRAATTTDGDLPLSFGQYTAVMSISDAPIADWHASQLAVEPVLSDYIHAGISYIFDNTTGTRSGGADGITNSTTSSSPRSSKNTAGPPDVYIHGTSNELVGLALNSIHHYQWKPKEASTIASLAEISSLLSLYSTWVNTKTSATWIVFVTQDQDTVTRIVTELRNFPLQSSTSSSGSTESGGGGGLFKVLIIADEVLLHNAFDSLSMFSPTPSSSPFPIPLYLASVWDEWWAARTPVSLSGSYRLFMESQSAQTSSSSSSIFTPSSSSSPPHPMRYRAFRLAIIMAEAVSRLLDERSAEALLYSIYGRRVLSVLDFALGPFSRDKCSDAVLESGNLIADRGCQCAKGPRRFYIHDAKYWIQRSLTPEIDRYSYRLPDGCGIVLEPLSKPSKFRPPPWLVAAAIGVGLGLGILFYSVYSLKNLDEHAFNKAMRSGIGFNVLKLVVEIIQAILIFTAGLDLVNDPEVNRLTALSGLVIIGIAFLVMLYVVGTRTGFLSRQVSDRPFDAQARLEWETRVRRTSVVSLFLKDLPSGVISAASVILFDANVVALLSFGVSCAMMGYKADSMKTFLKGLMTKDETELNAEEELRVQVEISRLLAEMYHDRQEKEQQLEASSSGNITPNASFTRKKMKVTVSRENSSLFSPPTDPNDHHQQQQQHTATDGGDNPLVVAPSSSSSAAAVHVNNQTEEPEEQELLILHSDSPAAERRAVATLIQQHFPGRYQTLLELSEQAMLQFRARNLTQNEFYAVVETEHTKMFDNLHIVQDFLFRLNKFAAVAKKREADKKAIRDKRRQSGGGDDGGGLERSASEDALGTGQISDGIHAWVTKSKKVGNASFNAPPPPPSGQTPHQPAEEGHTVQEHDIDNHQDDGKQGAGNKSKGVNGGDDDITSLEDV